MQRIALIMCLFLGVAFTLMPVASGAAAYEVRAHVQHGGQGAMPDRGSCPDCDPPQHDAARQACLTMGADCGAAAVCSVAITGITPDTIAFLLPRDLPVHPVLRRVQAQRALVPEPPPPRQ